MIIFYSALAMILTVMEKAGIAVPHFLFSVFVGMIMYTASLFIFQTRCPGQIKKFDTGADYANAEADHFRARHLLLRRLITYGETVIRRGPEKEHL